ncbi:MAG: metal ABC transporter permease [Firmicutes bacterium]|nr:metal ABC transporter permease [Bacillota bacterium]
MTALFGELFSYTFIVRALAAGTLIAFCSALLGVSLVLKRYSMIGDGLSHVGFGAFAVALALNASPLAVAIPIVVAAAFLLLRISSNAKIKGDAAVALISSRALAIGVIIVSSSVGINTDIYNYMFGSILAVSGNDVIISVICSVAVIILYILFYNRIFAVTFDEDFAKATGVRTGVYNSLIAVLTAVIVVVGMRLMGALLISSLIVFPALTSMRLCKSFKSVTICGVIVSIVCFIIGIVISFTKGVPAGAGVVVVNLAAFVIFTLIGIIKNSTAK